MSKHIDELDKILGKYLHSFSCDICDETDFSSTNLEVRKETKQAILQHFQQEQERVTILADSETGITATNATERAVWKETEADTFEFSHIEVEVNPYLKGNEWYLKYPTKEEKLYTQSEVGKLAKQARADQLKKLWNATQHDIVPEGTPPRDMSEELHKMIKELEGIK